MTIQHYIDTKIIEIGKQKSIDLNSQKKNKKRIPYTYNIGDKILLEGAKSAKHGAREYAFLYIVQQVN